MSANNIHLTPAERLNLKNLAVSVKLYGAIGDGNADDTSAFTSALENNNRVYVPGGTYKINGELIVRDNCELELARDAVLNFDPTYTKIVYDKELGRDIVTVIPYEKFCCITMSSSSRLIGNHATVRVHYGFKGKVIRIMANPEDDTSCTKPRYLKDINIVKVIKNGDYAYSCGSIDNQTNGTALLIEGTELNETTNPSILWGVEALGLRIAGAFDYGIRCINTNYEESGKTAWKYETCIDALIDGCRTGLYMDHYDNARISAVIKTRQAHRYMLDEDESLNYAEYGIHLVNCRYIDLRNSRIIDKDPETNTLTVSKEFKHINLDGVCRGLMIENSLCSETDGFNVRDYIHTTIPENFEGITILGEPMANYFNYTAHSAEGIIFPGKRINSQGCMVPQGNMTASGFIPCEKGKTISLKDITFVREGTDGTNNRIAPYTSNKRIIGTGVNGLYFGNNDYFTFSYNESTKTSEITISDERIKYIRFCCNSTGISYDSSIGIIDENNTKNFECKDGYLKDRIRVKAQYNSDLEQEFE